MKVFTFLVLIAGLLFAKDSHTQDWQIIDIGIGVKPAIAIGSDDLVHIAYMLESSSGFVKHAVYNGMGITEETVDIAYMYGPLDIALDRNNLPAIAVHNHELENQIVYRQIANGNWIFLETDHNGHDGWDNAIIFDDNGRIHTSSVDPQQFGGPGVEYGYYNGNSWQIEVIGSGSVPYMFSTGIALDINSMPHITYYDVQGNNLIHAYKSGSTWTMETIDSEGGMFSELISDEMGNLHVTYYSRLEDNEGIIKYAYHDGVNWKREVIDELYNVPIEFTGARDVSALAIDGNGTVHISYGDRDVVKLAVKTENGWDIETIRDVEGVDEKLGAQTQIAVDSKGGVHIVYFELTNATPLEGVIKYASKKASSTSVDDNLSNGYKVYPNPFTDVIELSIDRENEIDISFFITDIGGFIIHAGHLSEGNNISTENIPPGIYILNVISKSTIKSTKLIKIE